MEQVQETIRVLIADDHAVFREGLKQVLRKGKNIKVVGEACDGAELLRLYHETKPEVILTDILMPQMDGIESTRRIIESDEGAKIIALSMYDEERTVVEVMEAGARGYLIKNAGKTEILDAVKAVYEGKSYISNGISFNLIKLISDSNGKNKKELVKVEFNENELNVIQCICKEMSSKEIGEKLNLSPRTIDGYREEIMEKLGVKTKVGIVIYALRNGLF